MKKKDLIVVRGAGDLATGTIHRLKKAGFRLLVLEAEHPAAIRRQVALSEAVYAGSARVEDVEAVRMDVDLAEKKNRKELLEQEMERIWKKDGVPVLVDPAGLSIAALRPAVVVDAILAKKNLGTTKEMASLSGLLRGLIRDGYPVTKGFKIADIDPRKEELQNCFTISDKARCIAGSVLAVICGELE